MVFSSVTFLFVFLPVVLAVYYILPGRLRNTFLLLASLLFYYWGEPRFVFVMLASIVWNYLCGLMCGYLPERMRGLRKLALILAVAVNLGLLVYFKYADFIIGTINGVFSRSIPLLGVTLPIGISFFTFQGLSYVIDVYRQTVRPQRDPLKLGMYISLFPQLIAGPIVRYADIEREIDHRSVDREKFYAGVSRFVIGLSKKVLIANTLALRADQIFGQPCQSLTAGVAWLGALLYSLQIYFDFSGYSDMAIGLGKMLGFTFLENFDLPYMSRSVTEFWRRWHISLSSWFRDYVYIPLGGNRRGNVYLHLLTVFILTGLWHGAAWNFVLWGLWHGLFLIVERVLRGRIRGNRLMNIVGGVHAPCRYTRLGPVPG